MTPEGTAAEQAAAQAEPMPLAEHPDQTPKGLGQRVKSLAGKVPDLLRRTPTTKEPTVKMPKQNEFLEGGKSEPINLDSKAQKEIAKRISERIQVLKSQQSKERPLTDLDRILLRSGPETISRLETGNCNSQDASIAFYVLHDEIIQKSLSTAHLIKDNKILAVYKNRFGPFCRYLAESPHMQTQLEASWQKLNTEYIREIGFDTWGPERIENDLTTLNQLRHNLELSLTGLSIEDPLFDQISTSIYPFDLDRKTGNRLHDAIADELMGAEGVLTHRFGGKTYFELSQEDPIAATQALYEANQRALTHFAGEAGKDFLKAEAPKPDIQLIERQAVKLETKPTPDDLAKLQEAATKASTEFTTAQESLNSLRSPLETAQKTLAERQSAINRTTANFTRISERLDPEIERLKERVELLYNSIQAPDPSLTPEQKADLQGAVATTSQNIGRIEANLQSYQDQLTKLFQAQIDAELAHAEQNKAVTDLQNEQKEKALDEAQEDFNRKKEAKEQAEAKLKKQQETLMEISPETKEQAKALRRWNEVAGGYEQIINARFDQKYAEEYTRERLADVKERPDGQIEGAERIREHIFYLINKGEYDPELARKMLSDETIARAIIWVYKIDPETISANGNSLNQLLSDLNETKDMIKEAPGDKDLLNEKADQEKEIMKLALPHLRSSQFKTGDLLRFMAHEGLKSAEHGNPYLQLSEYYQTPAPELRLEAESIYRQEVGNIDIDIKTNTVSWIGPVTSSTIPGLINNNLPRTYRIDQQINPGNDTYSIEVLTDQRLLQSLPDRRLSSLPPEIQEAFYDEDGNLRADRKPFGSWTMIDQDSLQTTDHVLPRLEERVSPELSRLIPAAAADYMLQKTPQERLEILKRFSANIGASFLSTIEVPLIEDIYEGVPKRHNYTIDFDNSGNFLITDASTGSRQELKAFYQRRLEKFTNKLTLQAINAKQRETLRDDFLQVQSALGQEILRALQRR